MELREKVVRPRLRVLCLYLMILFIFWTIGFMFGFFLIRDYWWVFVLAFHILAMVPIITSYFYSEKAILKSYQAEIVEPRDVQKLWKSVMRVNSFFNLPQPRLAVSDVRTPNAFAIGRHPDNSIIVVTKGLLENLDDRQLDGVIAHVLALIKDRDILILTIAGAASSSIAFVAGRGMKLLRFARGSGYAVLLVAIALVFSIPLAVFFLKISISRARVFRADWTAALTIRRPKDVANALQKLEMLNRLIPIDVGNPASSCIFVINPFHGTRLARLLDTHPPVEERLKVLRKMAMETVSL